MQTTDLFKDKEIETFTHDSQRVSTMIFINLDEKCNENCAFCVVKGENVGKFGSMDKEEAKKTIKDFTNNGGKDIVFTGGEPTLRSDLPEIIEYAQQFKKISSISIITNGTNLGDKKYFQRIISADKRNLVTFSISLHSHKEIVSEQLTRVKGTFKKTIEGIENAIKNRKQVSIYQVITSNNYRDLFDFVKFLNLSFPEIRNVTFAYPFPQGSALLNDWIYVKLSVLRPFLLKALNFLEKENYQVNIASCGQFPLCTLPGFEEVVLKSLNWSEENISGVVGEKSYHEFEMMSPEWVNQYKNKNQKCDACVLNRFCQGFWNKYIDLFGFSGIKTVTKDNFKGNKIQLPLTSEKQLQTLIAKINDKKMNIIIIDKYSTSFLSKLFQHLKSNKLFAVVINKNNVIYPK